MTDTENLFGYSYNNKNFYLNLLINHPYNHPYNHPIFFNYTIDNYKDIVKQFKDSICPAILYNGIEDTYNFNKYAHEYLKIFVECNVDLSIENQYFLERAIKFGKNKIVRVFLSSPYIEPHLEDLEIIESKSGEKYAISSRNFVKLTGAQKLQAFP